MDLIFKRYADPFSFLDSMLCYGSFGVSVGKVIEYDDTDTLWEYYLNKVFDMTFDDFVKVSRVEYKEPITKAEFDTTIEMSQSILNDLDPIEGGGTC